MARSGGLQDWEVLEDPVLGPTVLNLVSKGLLRRR